VSRARPGRSRSLALAGVAGPVGFIAGWLVAGALTAGYSSVDEAISRLAANGAPNRALMTAAFVCFGIAVPAYALVLRRRLPGPAWAAAAASGVATLGVALFPLGISAGVDSAHNALAGLGYAALVAVPLLAAGPLAEGSHRRAAAASLVVGVAAGLCLMASLLGPVHGLDQRVGLTLLDLWLIASALVIVGVPVSSAPPGGQAQRPVRS